MDTLQTLVWFIMGISLVISLVVTREFVHTTTKREALLQDFHEDIRGTKQSRTLLAGVYIVMSIVLTLGFGIWFLTLLS